jgi:disulfide bond formation protein DsbB
VFAISALSHQKRLFGGILLASIAALVSAYYIQYVLGLVPCILCLYQRAPYYFLIFLSISGFYFERKHKIILTLILLTLLSSIVLSAYHSGVEREIFAPSESCIPNATPPIYLSPLEVKNWLYEREIGSCTKPAAVILSLSLTEWNLLYNLFLSFVVLLVFYRKKTKFDH